jgi:hypothetical protein
MSENKERGAGGVERGVIAGLLEALADKHSELNIYLQKVTIKLPNMQVGVELDGLITVTVHMRNLTDDEKRASAARNVGMMSTA